MELARFAWMADPTPDNEMKFRASEKYLLKLEVPASYHPALPNSGLIKHMEACEKSYAVMEENHVSNPRQLTEYVYFFRHKHITDNNKPKGI
jgi:hypothetical protein